MSEPHQPDISVEIGDGAQIAGNVIVNTGTMTTIVQAAQMLTSLHQLRAPINDFVGRTVEHEALLAALLPETGHARQAALVGMGGLGKTELAIHVAHSLREHYPDAQLFLSMRSSAGTRRPPAEALADAIRAFDPYATLPTDLDTLASRFCSHLDAKRVLVLLDDAPDDASVEPFLPPAGCALLVTSRTRLTLGGQGTIIDLALFSRDEARALLVNDAPQLATSGELEQLLAYCGDLPLAVRVAGATLANNPALSPSRYLARLADETKRPGALRYENSDVYAVLGVGDDLLASENPSLSQRWRMLGVCPAPFEAAAAGVIWNEADQDARDDALATLVRRSLLRYDPVTSQYRLHDLLRDLANQRRSPADDEIARFRHANYYLALAYEAQRSYKQGREHVLGGLKLFDANWQHIRAGANWAANSTTPASDQLITRYALEANDIIYARLTPLQQRQWFEAALAAAERLGDQRAKGRALVRIGQSYSSQAGFDTAITYFEQALVLLRATNDAEGEQQTMLGLGNALRRRGDATGAQNTYQQLLELAQHGDSANHASALIGLGTVAYDAQEPQQALAFYKQSLALLRTTANQYMLALVFNNIATVYDEQLNNQKQALGAYARALALARRIGDKELEAGICWGIGEALVKQGQIARALPFMQTTVAYEQSINHPYASEDAQRLAEIAAKVGYATSP